MNDKNEWRDWSTLWQQQPSVDIKRLRRGAHRKLWRMRRQDVEMLLRRKPFGFAGLRREVKYQESMRRRTGDGVSKLPNHEVGQHAGEPRAWSEGDEIRVGNGVQRLRAGRHVRGHKFYTLHHTGC